MLRLSAPRSRNVPLGERVDIAPGIVIRLPVGFVQLAIVETEARFNVAVALVIGFVALALVAASAVKNVTYKIVSVLFMAGLSLGVWTQRSNLQDCAQRVKNEQQIGQLGPTRCEFFGGTVNVPGVSSPSSP